MYGFSPVCTLLWAMRLLWNRNFLPQNSQPWIRSPSSSRLERDLAEREKSVGLSARGGVDADRGVLVMAIAGLLGVSASWDCFSGGVSDCGRGGRVSLSLSPLVLLFSKLELLLLLLLLLFTALRLLLLLTAVEELEEVLLQLLLSLELLSESGVAAAGAAPGVELLEKGGVSSPCRGEGEGEFPLAAEAAPGLVAPASCRSRCE